MIELKHYLHRSKNKALLQKILKRQAAEMQKGGSTFCGCGTQLNIMNSFRCLYCGLFLCVSCAETHFGITRETYDETP